MEPKNELDRQLDDLLAQYGSAEPRLGLENRVIARLRQEQKHPTSNWIRRPLFSAGAMAAAGVLVVVLLAHIFVSRKHQSSTDTQDQSPSRSSAIVTPRSNEPLGQKARRAPIRVAGAPARRVRAPKAAANPLPKLDLFPSTLPLNEQEQVLARYVTEYPERALLVARAQMAQVRKEIEEQGQLDDKNFNDPSLR